MPARGKVIPFPISPPPRPPDAAARPPRPPTSRPVPPAPRHDAGSDALVEVWRCRDQAELLVVRSVLDSEGIPTALRSNLAPSVHPFSVGDQAAGVVLVPAPEAERARRTLIARRRHLVRAR